MCKIVSKQESFGTTKARAGLTKTIFCAIFWFSRKVFFKVEAAAKYFKTRLRILELTSHTSWGARAKMK